MAPPTGDGLIAMLGLPLAVKAVPPLAITIEVGVEAVD